MENKFKRFPKIRQFADVIRHVKQQHDFQGLDEEGKPIYRHVSPYPVLNYSGTVKLHGTNSGVRIVDGQRIPQSRTRDISVGSDNAGFAAFIAGLPDEVWDCFPDDCVMFGEWCGQGIQKGVAINQLPKMWVLFDEYANDLHEETGGLSSEQVEFLNEHQIFFIKQFKQFEVTIDFSRPELAQEKIIEFTKAVGDQCPVGNRFGVEGIGEGIVFRPVFSSYARDSGTWFKSKDPRHSSSRVKTIAAVDVEKMNSVTEFVETTVTQNRLEQGIQVLKESGKQIDRSTTGDYLRWLVTDILDEEAAMLGKSGLCAKDVGKGISNKGREFLFGYIDSNF